jgi:hypothetical protein
MKGKRRRIEQHLNEWSAKVDGETESKNCERHFSTMGKNIICTTRSYSRRLRHQDAAGIATVMSAMSLIFAMVQRQRRARESCLGNPDVLA